MTLHLEVDDEELEKVAGLSRRELPAAQVHKFEGYMAEIFGAPVTEPPGKTAPISSAKPTSFRK